MKKLHYYLILSIACAAVSIILQAPVLAVPTRQLPNGSDELAMLENRFFFHRYEHDSPEKRLQRLELLVFGATQEGTNEERLFRLKNKALTRSEPALLPPKLQTSSSLLGNSLKILDKLEFKILKKATGGGSVNQRLATLETKLFGQASPQMSVAQRIERLKKATGLDVPEISTLPFQIPRRSRPYGMPPSANPYREGSPYSDMMPQFEWFFGSINESGQIDPRLSKMFEQLNQRLKELGKMPPGDFGINPQYPLKPDTLPYSPFAKPTIPDSAPHGPNLPPYYDPNSI